MQAQKAEQSLHLVEDITKDALEMMKIIDRNCTDSEQSRKMKIVLANFISKLNYDALDALLAKHPEVDTRYWKIEPEDF